MQDREVPNIEVEPSVYALQYWYANTYMTNGSKADSELNGLRLFVCYTYEQAVNELHDHIKELCEENKLKYYGGEVKITKYTSLTITSIFDSAYKEYGVPQPVEEEDKPELLNEDKG